MPSGQSVVNGRAKPAFAAGILALVAALGAGPAAAQAPDPVLGTWELNIAKSSFNPGPPPRSETRVMVQDGAVIRATSKGVDASSNPTQTAHREISKDGKTMTLTFKGVNAKGQTIHDVMVFERR